MVVEQKNSVDDEYDGNDANDDDDQKTATGAVWPHIRHHDLRLNFWFLDSHYMIFNFTKVLYGVW